MPFKKKGGKKKDWVVILSLYRRGYTAGEAGGVGGPCDDSFKRAEHLSA